MYKLTEQQKGPTPGVQTNHQGRKLLCKQITIKFDGVGEKPAIKNTNPNLLNRLKRVEKLRHLKSQPMFPEPSQTKWHETFAFPTGISSFLM